MPELALKSNTYFRSYHKIGGHLFFGVILFYAIYYAIERVAYLDSAWLFFDWVNREGFSFPVHRYGSVFSEMPLVFAAKLHLPFWLLVKIFSAGYIFLYFLVWRICTFKLKNDLAGLVIIFGMCFGIRETFLHIVSETHQIIAFSAFLFAIFQFDFKRIGWKYFWVIFISTLIVYTHPMGLFTGGFVAIYFMIEKKSVKEKLPWLAIIIFLLISLKSFLLPNNSYDADQYGALTSTKNILETITSSAPVNFLLIHFWHFYWIPELVGLICIGWLIINRSWFKLSFLIVAVLSFFTIASLIFHHGDSSIMLERIFLPAFFMIHLVFSDLLFAERKIKPFILGLVVVFFVGNGIHYINTACLMYKKRVGYLETLVSQGITEGHNFYYLSKEKNDPEKLLAPWAIGAESLIVSKYKFDKCISVTTPGDTCSVGSCRITSITCLPIKEFNSTYFKFAEEGYYELR